MGDNPKSRENLKLGSIARTLDPSGPKKKLFAMKLNENDWNRVCTLATAWECSKAEAYRRAVEEAFEANRDDVEKMIAERRLDEE